MTLKLTTICHYAECRHVECHVFIYCYAECHYAECRDMLNVIMPSVVSPRLDDPDEMLS
jgi:hypothetical protein